MSDIQCAYCGKENCVPAVIDSNTNAVICANCYVHCNTCAMCQQVRFCDFETNPSSLPKQVQKFVRQGNMTIQTVEKAPSRIEITCAAGCPCFDPEFGCLKQNGTCANYKEREPYA